ncbi:unnamed protein product [Effrenium voratum]|uniref:Uncharacterized protein n=1 Tax=Effrenium voratum TaxID=2562239 RepID=A0AA36HKL0_9DINO|nr:unnamed protein product [Effrenium voratum]
MVLREKVDMSQCRQSLRQTCKKVRFCCACHRDRCLLKVPLQARGKREPMDAKQLADLFERLCKAGKPWAAVLSLLQLQCGERADCARRCTTAWLHHIDPGSAEPPFICIPNFNRKTKAREVPLCAPFAVALYGWLHISPLTGAKNSQWPFTAPVQTDADQLLFPGLSKEAGQGKGCRRDWRRPVTERAYLASISQVAAALRRERQEARQELRTHLWDDVDLSKLGTHSLKRSSVCLLKDVCMSTAVVAAICGTTARTLDKIYDAPTRKRQRAAATDAFASLMSSLRSASVSGAGRRKMLFCCACGEKRASDAWQCCPFCGKAYYDG